MTDKEKLIKIKKLADAMYYGAFNMTTDASLLKKAMKEYRQFTIHEYCKEEPVSKDLEKASKSYGEEQYNKKLNLLPDKCRACYDPIVNAFKAGAKWQYEQFEKNRLAACDRQTKEEAEIERDFVTNIIEKEHRQPTYNDAIKYGMKLKEQQMINSAIDATIGYWNHSGMSIDVKLPKDLKENSKCKLIIIKDE